MTSTFVYDYIIGCLCATSYLPVKSVQVSCVSLHVSLLLSICLLLFV